MIAVEWARRDGPELERRLAGLSDFASTLVRMAPVLSSALQTHLRSQLQQPLEAQQQGPPFSGAAHEGTALRVDPAVLAVAAGLRPPLEAPPTQPPPPPTPVDPYFSLPVTSSATAAASAAAVPPRPLPAAAPAPFLAASPPPPPPLPLPLPTPPAPPPPPEELPSIRRTRTFREVAVPASPLSRVWGFGSLAASMVAGAIGEATSRAMFAPPAGAPLPGVGALSEAQAERLAEGLCRLRGAALKLGQMLSLSDEALLPPVVSKALERVRAQADVMPRRQLEAQMTSELGPDWRARLGGDAFQDAPVAAASIGQVHRSVLPDGRAVAIKVQYPGVAESIDSDLNNLKRLLSVTNFLPKGLYLDPMIEVAREELTAECDYVREAEAQERYRALVADDPDFEVPTVVKELSTRRVLVTTWLPGVPIDAVLENGTPPEERNRIARKLLKLTLKELFEWRFMQTDPNWGNFFYDAASQRIGLLDFGATRDYPKPFVDDYLRLVWAAANRDRATIEAVSLRVGFLTGHESKAMLNAHVDSGLVVGEPFLSYEPFDFKASGITRRVSGHGATFAEERLTAPPPEVYSLHRKLAGAFLICIKLGAKMPCRDMLETFWRTHVFGAEASLPKRNVVVGRA